MNTRKKCIACGLISFALDEVCKRCGSDKLFEYAMPEDLPPETIKSSVNEMHFLNYFACFMLACIVEFVALLPVLANIGWRHSSAAPETDFEISSKFTAFILHLPTSAFIWLLMDFEFVVVLLFSAQIIQIIFWTYMFTKLWRRMNNWDNKLK